MECLSKAGCRDAIRHILNESNKRLHRTNFRCHLLCKRRTKVAIKNLLGEPGVSLTRKVMRNLIVILVLFVTTLAVHAEDFNWRTGDGAKAPNTKNQKSISGFGGWLLVTPDKDW